MEPRKPSKWVRPLKPVANPKLRLFCFHSGAALPSLFLRWRDFAPDWIEVCPVHLPGRGLRGTETPFTDFSALVGAVADALVEFCDVPFAVFGHSMGSLLSFEVTRALQSRGHIAVCLTTSCCVSPNQEIGKWWPDGTAPYTKKQPFLPYHAYPEKRLLEMQAAKGYLTNDLLANEEFLSRFVALTRLDFCVIYSYKYQRDPHLKMPLFSLGGDGDLLVLPEDIAKWGTLTSKENFSYRIIEGSGHFVLNSHLDEFVASVFKYIEVECQKQNVR